MEERRVILSFGSFVWSGALIGLSSGLLAGVFGSIVLLFQASWWAALFTLPVVLISNTVGFMFYAAIGYILYKPMVMKFPDLGVFKAEYYPVETPVDISMVEPSNKSLKGGDAP